MDSVRAVLPMILQLKVDEAIAIYVAAVAVRTQYELENMTTDDAYRALVDGIEQLERQLWNGRPPEKEDRN